MNINEQKPEAKALRRTFIAVAAAVGTFRTGGLAQSAKAPAFEVASIKPSDPGASGWTIGRGPNGASWIGRNVTTRRMIINAYQIPDWMIEGGPAWLDSNRYDLNAKPEHPVTAAEGQAMLRTLLADRFKLVMRKETVERSLFVLVVDKIGPGLKLHKETDGDRKDFIGNRGAGHAIFENASMVRLAFFLSGASGRAVVDKTGLAGGYDFSLDFSPIRSPADVGSPALPDGDSSLPELFTAVKEQLGLKLVSQRGLVEIFHIENVEMPEGN